MRRKFMKRSPSTAVSSIARFVYLRASQTRSYISQWKLWLRQRLTIPEIIFHRSKGMLELSKLNFPDRSQESLSCETLRTRFLERWPNEANSSDFKIWLRWVEVSFISFLTHRAENKVA